MGKKWSTVSVSNYKALSVPDDGTVTESNRVKYATITTDLTDPIKTATDTIVANLDQLFTEATTAVTTNYTSVASDHATWLEVTGTKTITLLAASTAGAGYKVGVKNAGAGIVTVARSGSDTIGGVTSKPLAADESALYVVNGAGNGYIETNKHQRANGTLVTTGTEPAYAVTTNRSISSYAAGDMFICEIHSSNASATVAAPTTLNVDGVGAKNVVYASATSVILAANALNADGVYIFVYDDTNDVFQCLNPTSVGPTVQTYTSTGANTWTKPAGLNRIFVQVVGAGGGGGGAEATGAGEASCGSGGGAGGYAEVMIGTGDLGATETATVGAGGAGGVGNATGATGGTSTFTRTTGSNPSASGGAGGASTTAGLSTAMASTGLAGFGSNGNFSGSGANGHPGIALGSSDRANGAAALGGNGGAMLWGRSARGPASGSLNTADGNGQAGNGQGAGGAGAAGSNSAVAQDGSAGRNGVIIVTEYYF